MSDVDQHRGELTARLTAMPADTNANGDIFWGWGVAPMDLAGAIAASKRSQGRVATVAIEAMSFLKPVHVGDILCVYTEVIETGRTSMRIRIEAWAQSQFSPRCARVTEGIFTFVAIDDKKQKRLLPDQTDIIV